MNHPNTGGDPRSESTRDASGAATPAERSFDPAGEREPGVPADTGEAWPTGGHGDAHPDARRRHAGSRSAGEAAERSVDVGGSPGAVPDDLRRERRPRESKES